MSEPKLNQAVTGAIEGLMSPLPAPVTHGQFNRRLFLGAFISKAGIGMSISPDDIMEHGAITEREFKVILNEYITKGVIVKEDNVFGVEMYKLNMKATP
jgi:hypothetical protein